MFGKLVDERFRNVAAGVYAYAPVRLALCACVAAFVGMGVGWLPAILWASAALTAEAAMLFVTRATARSGSDASIRACMIVYALAIPTWSLAGVILWNGPTPACNLAGAAFFAGHLLYIQAHHAHSPGAALPALPSVLAPAIVPLVFPHFRGTEQAIVCLTMAAVVLHSLLSMWVSLGKSLDLQDAQAAQAAASRAKGEFLARMSHEIRTPLNGVLGMAQALAADADLAPEHRRRLDVIRQSGESLLTILNDVLDLSKVEAGRLELEAAPFDLEAVARSAQETFAPQAESKGVGFRLEIRAGAAGAYLGDPTRLRQILFNLLSNAVKFTDAGEVSLDISRDADALRFVVADTGIGIDGEEARRLFSPFQQADTSIARRYGGSGLGLSICRELAELMGGSVSLESAPGVGSRFGVVLPLPRLQGASTASTAAAATQPARLESGPLRVLAAEDNPVNQLVLRTLLEQIGVQPDMVGDGEAAVEAWRSGAYDVILMDVQMPVMDGIAATRSIRLAEAESNQSPTPILALTANAMKHQVAEYLAAGFDGHVAKPIDAARLYEALGAAAAGPLGDSSSAAA